MFRGDGTPAKRPTVLAHAVIALASFAEAFAAGQMAGATDTGQDSLEPGDIYPGGNATTLKSADHRDVFSQPSRGMGFEGELNFKVGNALFRKFWVASPASTKSSDGLGPIYNSRSCQTCHLKDGRGHPPNGNWPEDDAVSMFLRLSIPPQSEADRQLLAGRRANVIKEPTYGGQLQDLAIPGHDAEGRMHITYEEIPVTLADGTIVNLRKPTYTVTNLSFGPLHPDAMLSPRVAPQMIGLGLLEAIPEDAIRALADPDDADGDGISGRAGEVWSFENDRVMLGRFGWKAGNPTVRQQTADAFSGDMGLSTTLFPGGHGECTVAQAACRAALNGEDATKRTPEVTDEMLRLVTFYAENLAVPARRKTDDSNVLKGKALFSDAGCASCHRPAFVTSDVPGQPHLSGQSIWPYTDLLLHDMGEGLADHRPEGIASGREWRTPPLWGIGLTETVSGHTFFMHDGRARSLEEAILWHGGEAQAAREAYSSMTESERDALIAFVKSL